MAALVGGGSHLARPGAISLAHHGVLFLDEAPEFAPRALDALRQPLEGGRVVLHRGGGAVTLSGPVPARAGRQPVSRAAARPATACARPRSRRRYQQRLSGPLLDRIDVRVQVDPVAHAELFDTGAGRETTAAVAARVAAARAAAAERWRGTRWRCNAEVPGPALRRAPWALPRGCVAPAEGYLQRGELSARGFDRVLRLAWTLADLAGAHRPDSERRRRGAVLPHRRGQGRAA